jgi:hypothetical protein
MQASALQDALATFRKNVRRRPGFAAGWNKRTTIHHLLDQNDKLPCQCDGQCDEVLKRNPRHFGALSGAGRIHRRLHLRPGQLRGCESFTHVRPARHNPPARRCKCSPWLNHGSALRLDPTGLTQFSGMAEKLTASDLVPGAGRAERSTRGSLTICYNTRRPPA